MSDLITLVSFEIISIDLKSERERINTPRTFNRNQRKVLLSAIDKFEVGDIQGMVNMLQNENSKKYFHGSVWEYLDEKFYQVVGDIHFETKNWRLVKI